MSGIKKISHRAIRRAAIVAFLIVAAALLRQIGLRSESGLVDRVAAISRTLIHFGLFIAWGFSIRRRIMQKQAGETLTAIAALMVFWLLVRTIKYLFISDNPHIGRYLWYAYYIPMLLIPMLSILVALSLGRPESYRLPARTRLLYIPTLLLIALVLTNDLHQFVFSFPGALWTDRDNGYGTGFWLVFGWMILCAMAALGTILARSRVPRSRRILWLPFVPLFLIIAYGLMNMLRLPVIKAVAGDMTVVFCLFIMGIFESCIQIGLIRSNTNYEGLFFSAGLSARIVDSDYRLRYSTRDARPLSEETMRRAEIAPVELDENTRLSSAPITGGHALWLEDLSEINRLLTELKEAGEELTGKNELLQAELALKERSARVDEKTRLYDKLTREVSPQLRTLDKLLSGGSGGAVPPGEKLTWLCILGSFIKRRSNLIILSEDSAFLSAKELEYCFRESTEAISECGISCFFSRHCEGLISTESALPVYDLFEEIVEAALPALKALFVNLRVLDGHIELRMQISGNIDGLSADGLSHLPRLICRGGHLTETVEDDTLHLSLTLFEGGERP